MPWSDGSMTVSRPVGGVLSAPEERGGHPSKRPTWGLPPFRGAGGQPMSHARPCSGWGLPSRPGHPGRWCALTAPFHPCLCEPKSVIGGLFSVALSFGSPRLAVSQHPALWSPDLPRHGPRQRRTRAAATRPAHRHHQSARLRQPLDRVGPWCSQAVRRAFHSSALTHCRFPPCTRGWWARSSPRSRGDGLYGSEARFSRSRTVPGTAISTWSIPMGPGTARPC